MLESNIKKLKPLLDEPGKRIMIVCHARPDGDAIGSMLALYHYLRAKDHKPTPVSPTPVGSSYKWMPGADAIINFPEHQQSVKNLAQHADLIFCLDFNDLSRIEDMEGMLRLSSAPLVMIDHHLEPQGFDAYRHWDSETVATAYLVADVVRELGDFSVLDLNMATCIYTGLVTDSGSFRYSSVDGEVHKLVAQLLDLGLNHTHVHKQLYESTSERRLRFLGHCLKEKLTLVPQFQLAYMAISFGEQIEYSVTSDDTEGIVNYGLSLEDIKISVFMTEREDHVKLSLRSKGRFPANELAAEFFNGGGHLNAAGGRVELSLEETVERLLKGMNRFKDILAIS